MKRVFIILTFILSFSFSYGQSVSSDESTVNLNNKIEQAFSYIDLLHKQNDTPNTAIHQQSSVIWVLDSMYSYDYYGDWFLSSREIITNRDNKGKATNIISAYRNNNETWENDLLTSYTYYNSGVIHTETSLAWDSNTSQWTDTLYYTEFKESGKLIKSLNPDVRTFFSFNNDGSYSSSKDYTLNESNHQWELTGQTIFENNSSGYPIKYTAQLWNSTRSSWVDFIQLKLSYDSYNNIKEHFVSIWDETTSTWTPYSKTAFTYHSSGQIEREESLIWDAENQSWGNSFREITSFNSNGDETSRLEELWNAMTDSWLSTSQSLTSYDNNNNIHEFIHQIWTGTEWQSTDKEEFFWSQFRTTSVADISLSNVNIYPNPVSNQLYISLEKPLKKNQISIYSIDGTLKQVNVKSNNNTIDASTLRTGTYYLLMKGAKPKIFIKQ